MKKNPWNTIPLRGTPFQLARCGYSTQAHLYDTRNKRATGITICGDTITGPPNAFKRNYMTEPPIDCGICWGELNIYMAYMKEKNMKNPGASFHSRRAAMFREDAVRWPNSKTPYRSLATENELLADYSRKGLRNPKRNPKSKSKWIVPALVVALGLWYLNRNKS